MDSIIKCIDIYKDFPLPNNRSVRVLKGITAEFPANELTVLKGRSGSGKTTLMNILGMLDKPTSGRIYINGHDITDISSDNADELRRNFISFVFQSVALIGSMTAYQNVEFMLRVAGLPMEKDRILHCLDMVGLSNRVNHYPYQLSGGEQQRVAIARSIVHNPKIIFADEPTAQLDSNTSEKVMEMFHRIIREENTTVIMTTHDQNMMELADKVYTLDDGMISTITDNKGVE